MTAVIGEDKILFLQLSGKSHGRELLSHAGMNRTVQLAQGKELKKLLLHLSDAQRLLEDLMIDGFRIRAQNIVLMMTGTAGLPL